MKTSPIQSEFHDYENRWKGGNCPHILKYRVPFPRAISWEDAERAYGSYSRRYGTGQSLERLSERGGFGALALLSLLCFFMMFQTMKIFGIIG